MDYLNLTSTIDANALREWIISRRERVLSGKNYDCDNAWLGRVMAYSEIIKKLEECDIQHERKEG